MLKINSRKATSRLVRGVRVHQARRRPAGEALDIHQALLELGACPACQGGLVNARCTSCGAFYPETGTCE